MYWKVSKLPRLSKRRLLPKPSDIFPVLDGDGFINFKEFLEVHKKEGGVKTVDIQSAFRSYDLKGDGKISAVEVLQVLRRLGLKCGLEDFAEKLTPTGWFGQHGLVHDHDDSFYEDFSI